jgi:hypothetical protein
MQFLANKGELLMTYSKKNMTASGRRNFLRGAGSMIALPFLESIPRAFGAEKAPPRLVCLGVSLSMYPEEWNPKDTGRGYALPKLLEPLQDLRDDFTVISNSDHPGVTGGHKGTPAFLSGVYRPERVGQAIVIRNQITLDQFAAKRLGAATRYESLQLGAANVGPDDSLSWNDTGVPLPAMGDPLRAFQQLFVDESDPQALARSVQFGRSVLDTAQEDAKQLQRTLPKEDRLRLDEYMTSVRGVETEIQRQLQWVSTPKPKVPPLTERPTTYHQNLDLMLQICALALQTDSTRIVSVALPGSGLPIETGSLRTANYHGQSHHGKDPKVVAELVQIETMHTLSLAKFLKRLKSIPAPGGNLLDSTQVLFGSGLGNGSSHSNRDLPVLVAGGGYRHGNHVSLPEGTPLTNLFVTMLQHMGLDVKRFAGSEGNMNAILSV